MATNQENVSKILSVLSHPLRREILLNISERGECSFTDLMNALSVDTGKLSFHIRVLLPFLEQTSTGKYRLSKVGENTIRLIRDVESLSVEAEVSTKGSMLPLANLRKRTLAFLIDFAITFGVFVALPNVFSVISKGVGFLLDFNVIALFLILLWVYFTLLEGFAGQSLGKRFVGLTVVRVDGKRLFYDHTAVRNFGKAFLLPFDLFFGLRLKDARFIRYFDKFAGTTVIDLRL